MSATQQKMVNGNPFLQGKAKLEELDVKVKKWLKKQPAAVEVAMVTAGSAFQGGAIGALMGSFTQDLAQGLPASNGSLNPQAAASIQQAKVWGFSVLAGQAQSEFACMPLGRSTCMFIMTCTLSTLSTMTILGFRRPESHSFSHFLILSRILATWENSFVRSGQ